MSAFPLKPTMSSRGSILVVENEAIIAADLSNKLTALGYDVCDLISRGEDVFPAVCANRPDLILMDIGLDGDIDGVQAAEMVNQKFQIPIIFLTAQANCPTLGRATASSPEAFLLKPFQELQLEAHIEIARTKHRTKQELGASLSLLQATLESTADGILVVNLDGNIVTYNQNFLKMWKIPQELLTTNGGDRRALEFVVEQLASPEEFSAKVREIYSNPSLESFDVLEFKNGRSFERFSRPQMIDDKIAGRVWSFRDVTVRRNALKDLKELNDHLEQRIARRTASLEKANEELRQEMFLRLQTEHEILQISEREQRRIGHDLHDGICQELAGISFSIEGIIRKISPQRSERNLLVKLAEYVRTTLQHTRRISRGLAPAELETGNLASALHELAAKTEAILRICCTLECEGDWIIEPSKASHLYRIAQEALQNAIKHGQAKVVIIRLRRVGEACSLRIEDDGIGFCENPAADLPASGMGLKIMRYRSEMFGGRMEIISSIPGCTCVECLFPQ